MGGKMVKREGDKGEESEREGEGRVHHITVKTREAKDIQCIKSA